MADEKALVVEDDSNVAELLRLYLSRAGYKVIMAKDGLTGLDLFRDHQPDIVILDVMLPQMDGWEVCRQIRRQSDAPVIMLTARGESTDKLLGFEIGADDYVVKPFDPAELVARVRAVLRRGRPGSQQQNGKAMSFPGLLVDPHQYRVELQGRVIELAPKEFELLQFLVSHPNQVFTREQLLNQVWGYDYLGDSRTVDVHVKNLRKKLDGGRAWRIATVWGVGYKFEVDPGVS